MAKGRRIPRQRPVGQQPARPGQRDQGSLGSRPKPPAGGRVDGARSPVRDVHPSSPPDNAGKASVATLLVTGGVASAAALLVYLATISPTLPPGDSGDLITAASTLGIAHPPGYPLFAIVGHLFTLIPVGSPAYRVNLMSAVFDAAAVGVVAILIHRSVAGAASRRRASLDLVLAGVAAVIGALFLAFASEFWLYSLVAEVFAMNNLFAAVLLLLAYSWYEDPGRRWVLRGFFLASGLAFCNQQTIVLLAPGLATLLVGGILRARARGGPWMSRVVRDFASGLAFLVVGLLPYLYLPLAAAGNPPALWGDPSTLQRFVAVVTRADYGSFSLVAGGRHGSVGDNLAAFGTYLVGSFGPVGLLCAVLGVWWLARHRPVAGLALALGFLVTGPLFLAYANPPLDGVLAGIFARFYILPSVPLAVIIGCGSWQLLGWVGAAAAAVQRGREGRLHLAAAGVMAVLLVATVVGPAAARYGSIDQSRNLMTINFVRDLLAPLDRNAILLTEGDTAVLGTWYVQSVEDYRPDIVVIAVPLLHFQWYVDQLRRQHPDVVIPFEAADVVGTSVTDKVVNGNFATRPVYYVGVIPESFPEGYGEIHTGFARKFVRAADGGDPFAYSRANLPTLEAYHFPTRLFPMTSWEAWESTYYGGAAFDLANTYETIDVPTAERWYRLAIDLAPNIPGAYKNLAILLSVNGGRPAEVADLLERYLVLAPQDPEAATIRASIAQLRGTSP